MAMLTSDDGRDLCSTVCFLSLLNRGNRPRALIATRNIPLARVTDNNFDIEELPYKQTVNQLNANVLYSTDPYNKTN